ncbi:Maf-like protein [Chlamydia sp.]|uniref:Maf-like protein n=1 Tax=Chlamydia sp. TaxID=35827 RepID=UPI0025C34F0E|nr:Maf-like protein [Chlamydia sp.]MBQ8498247.1 septum formation protein Maf [Chlamydia sp.]
MGTQLVLGSSSERRRAVLEVFRIPFVCVSSDFDERSIAYSGDPFEYTKELAWNKAASVCSRGFSDSLIIAADTVVVHKGKVFNKPESEEHAIEMLQTLSGSSHSVITTLVLMQNKKVLSASETTQVSFIDIPPQYLKTYVRAFSSLKRCGGYCVQDGGGLIIKQIEGCVYNIQGLPIKTLNQLLMEFNVSLWDYLV